jgi:biuret amidohydrolase
MLTDACGAGHAEAGERALESMKFMGDAMLTDIQAILRVLSRMRPA